MNDIAAPHVRLLPTSRRRALLARHAQLLRYLVIGGGAFVLDLGLFALLMFATDMPPLLANTVSVFASMLFSYLANAFHNFNVRDRMLLRLVSFVAVCGIGYLLSTGLLWIGTDLLALDPTLAKVLTLPPVVLFQFVLNKRITFRGAVGPDRSAQTPQPTHDTQPERTAA